MKASVVTTAAVLGLLATACASVDVVRLTQEKFPPKASADEVEILGKAPEGPYIQLADLRMSDSSLSTETMQRKILEKAARLGADAVVFSKPQTQIEHRVAYDDPFWYCGFGCPGLGWGSPWGMGWGSPWGVGWGGSWSAGGWGLGGYAVPYDVALTTLSGTAIRYAPTWIGR